MVQTERSQNWREYLDDDINSDVIKSGESTGEKPPFVVYEQDSLKTQKLIQDALNGSAIFDPNDEMDIQKRERISNPSIDAGEDKYCRRMEVDGKNMIAVDANFKQSLAAVSFSGHGRKRQDRL